MSAPRRAAGKVHTPHWHVSEGCVLSDFGRFRHVSGATSCRSRRSVIAAGAGVLKHCDHIGPRKLNGDAIVPITFCWGQLRIIGRARWTPGLQSSHVRSAFPPHLHSREGHTDYDGTEYQTSCSDLGNAADDGNEYK